MVMSLKQMIIIFKLSEFNSFFLYFTVLPHRFGDGNGNPLQCSCLENPMDKGAWWATAHGVAKRLTTNGHD